ncbi:hypothetical protein GW17_00047142 [Ensete ventricosum]|nr:hypothetical protein GW17_00047142 [Ensete ventricosum]
MHPIDVSLLNLRSPCVMTPPPTALPVSVLAANPTLVVITGWIKNRSGSVGWGGVRSIIGTHVPPPPIRARILPEVSNCYAYAKERKKLHRHAYGWPFHVRSTVSQRVRDREADKQRRLLGPIADIVDYRPLVFSSPCVSM